MARPLALLASVLLAGTPAGADTARKEPAPALGKSLAGASFFDLSGRRHDLADVKAGCVVVVFWVFWCDTWKQALPALSALAEERDALDCAIWSVSVDGRCTTQIRPLSAAGRVPFPLLLDDGAQARRLGVRRVPTVLVLDKRRCVVWAHEGYPGNAALRRAVRAATRRP